MYIVFFIISFLLAVVISASLILTLMYQFRPKSKSIELPSGFESAAMDFNLSIKKREGLGHGVIGFDPVQNKVLFTQRDKNKESGYLLDLKDFESCIVRKTFADAKSETGTEILSIGLQLHFKNGNKPVFLPFYDKETDPVSEVGERAEQARNWQALIAAHLIKDHSIEKETATGLEKHLPLLKRIA